MVPAYLLASATVAVLLIASPASAEDCAVTASPAAISANAASLDSLAWNPFGRPEIGWSVYYPRIGLEIGTTCAAITPGFAASLATWQGLHHLPATGIFDPPTFAAMKTGWQQERPFVRLNARDNCPPPPAADMLSVASPAEAYRGKLIELRSHALDAYRALVAAARKVPSIASEARAFKIFSGFRDPDADAARCVAEGNCNGVVRATCSAHRTGLALDMWVGQAPGFGPDSSADINRLAMVHGATYRWLLVNAGRFGFVNYAFEPWHWEWTGEPF